MILCLSKKHVTTQNIKKCYINTTIIDTDISSPQISLMFGKLKYWVLVYKNLVLKEIPKTCIWHPCDFLVTLKKMENQEWNHYFHQLQNLDAIYWDNVIKDLKKDCRLLCSKKFLQKCILSSYVFIYDIYCDFMLKNEPLC